MKSIIVGLIILITVFGGVFYFFRESKDVPYQTPVSSEPVSQPVQTDMVRVTSPLSNVLIGNPAVVTGEARGNWYFEASFPIRVLDANGVELGIGIAQAQGDWMTTEFVPFTASITYTPSATETGVLRLEKDNPSGLPEFDAHVNVPIRFK